MIKNIFICLKITAKTQEVRNLARAQTMANPTYGDQDLSKVEKMEA